MKKKIIPYIIFITGFCIFFYPIFSKQYNAKRQSQAILDYEVALEQLNITSKEEILEEARRYNQELYLPSSNLDTQIRPYKEQLQIDSSDVIGYIEISEIFLNLPIKLGSSETVLANNVGHVESSSLPVGGENTHAVLSAHTGLPSSQLFSQLDQLKIGDKFKITVLTEELYYQVDQILVVEPTDTKDLEIIPEMDYVTLVTCTPYGINTHRLLVRGQRCEGPLPEASGFDWGIFRAFIMGFALLFVYFMILTGFRKFYRQKI